MGDLQVFRIAELKTSWTENIVKKLRSIARLCGVSWRGRMKITSWHHH